MRHRIGWKRLGRDPRHRRALLRNLLIALVKHERIMTTLPKAKELRRTGDKLVTLAKRGTEESRGKAWNWLQNPALMEKLYDNLKVRFIDRPGGYTRVLRAPKRQGDNAQMAVIEFLGNPLAHIAVSDYVLLDNERYYCTSFDHKEEEIKYSDLSNFPPLPSPRQERLEIESSEVAVVADENTVDCTEDVVENMSSLSIEDGEKTKLIDEDKKAYQSIPVSSNTERGRGKDLGTPV